MSSAALLGPGGPLSERLSGYERRDGQLAMARAVERTLADDRILLCEAGTGTGKTLAYLVPALRSGRKVVVSTASKALQEQIAYKDLPLIREHLGLEVDAVLIKGLNNYLCLRRYHELRNGFVDTRGSRIATQVARALPVVEGWAAQTSSGDRALVDELEESHPIWQLVTSSSETRVGARCAHFDTCHVTRLKRASVHAQLLIVNHHLLFADLAIKGDHPGGVLPAYDALVVDEAHRLEDVATGFFGSSVSSGSVERMLADLERTLRAELLHHGSDPPVYLAAARARAADLFVVLNVGAAPSTNEVREPLPDLDGRPGLRDRYFALDDALAQVVQVLTNHANVSEPLGHAKERVARVRHDLSAIFYPERARVAWLDRGPNGVTIAASPVDVGPLLRERVFARGTAVVLTSATLTAARKFDFVKMRLGLDEPLDTPVDELLVAEGLDYESNALLYLPTDLPQVTDAAFGARAGERAAELIKTTPGGAFILCTSLRSMHAFAHELARLAPERHRMVQGESPKRSLLERFRASGDAVLIATMSFWEGVDVPGAALRLVIIDRLPFDVPSDPLVAARCRAIDERGGSAFREYSVPRAAIVLKQGFGRLLRTKDDRGVVAILDRRIATKSYGRTLLDSLPDAPRTDSLAAVESFWARNGSAL
jgi:ATP-dependent DNA helicase DinG